MSAARLRRRPLPSRLSRADDGAAPVAPAGPGGRRQAHCATGLAALRPRPVRTVGDLLEHVPFRHEDFRERRPLADLPVGEEATIAGHRRERPRAAHPAPQPGDRRGARARRVRPGRAGLVQPALPGQAAAAGHACSRCAASGAARSAPRSPCAKQHEILGDGESRSHTSGLVPVYHASETLTSRRMRRPGRRPAGPRRRRARLAALPAAQRAAAAAAPRRRCWPRTGRDTLDQARGGRAAAGVRGAVPAAGRAVRHRRGAGAHARSARALGVPGEMAARFLDVAAVHAHGGADRGDGRDRRRPRPQRADAAAAAGRRRLGQDSWWPCTRCCGPSSATARAR